MMYCIFYKYVCHQNSVEIVLNCLVERKKIPDLASSIVDQRYNDQKMRLKETGFSRIVYLVEGDFKTQDTLPPEALHTAMSKTEVWNHLWTDSIWTLVQL